MPQQKAEMMCRFYHCYNVFARIRAVKCHAFPALLDCFPAEVLAFISILVYIMMKECVHIGE